MRAIPVFVVGSARSGTTFLGRSLNNHKDIFCSVEKEPAFSYTVSLAMHPERFAEKDTVGALQSAYADTWRGHSAKILADKSHQNILNVECIVKAFPNAKFIHIVRDGRDVISSMLRHTGVRSRFSDAEELGITVFPNRWFGINSAADYASWKKYSIVQKCAARWASWVSAGIVAERKFAGRFIRVRYEDMTTLPKKVANKICTFLGLPIDQSIFSAAKKSSIGNWKKEEDKINKASFIFSEWLTALNY